MRVYVASRIPELARSVADRLTSLGHVITHDWWNEAPMPTDELARRAFRRGIAERDLAGVASAELLLLLDHPQGKGIYVELGHALALSIPVAIVGCAYRQVWFELPTVELFDTVDDVLARIGAA